MKSWQVRYLLLALTSLLLLLWANSSDSAEAPEVVLIRVPPGWTAPREGYYLTAEALSNLTAASKTYRLERDAWEQAYYELSDMAGAFRTDIEGQIAGLTQQPENERAAWAKSLRRSRSPRIGVFGGVGYGPGGSLEPWVGPGAAWQGG